LRDDEDEVPVEDPDEGPQIVFIEIPNVKE
jgi:hypothetical protein